jgi:hypothetical protein
MKQALQLITDFYGDRKAERSGVPLINHIHEGLAIMREIKASSMACDAFCLHPLVQSDEELPRNVQVLNFFPPYIAVLVMEYRNQANAWLSDKVVNDAGTDEHGIKTLRVRPNYRLIGTPTPGPLPGVRQMLIADKVQNYKDFMLYHYGKHERSAELEHYFGVWLSVLKITSEQCVKLMDVAWKATA